MNKLIMTVLALGLVSGAYASDFGGLTGVNADGLKASVSQEDPGISRVLFSDTGGAGRMKGWCDEHSMAPGCCGYCKASPMYPGCPVYCAKHDWQKPACANGGACGSPKCFLGTESGLKSDVGEKGWCDEHSMAPGCCGYCKVSPMYPGCPVYCAKHDWQKPACANGGACGSPKNIDDKILCPPGAMLPGCPSFCAVYPQDPTCEAIGVNDEDKMLCPPGAMLPGCPSFCAVYPQDPACEAIGVNDEDKMLCPPGAMIPGCPAYCAVYGAQDPVSCEAIGVND